MTSIGDICEHLFTEMTVQVDSAVMILRKELFGINCLMSELLMQCNEMVFQLGQPSGGSKIDLLVDF